MTSWAKLLKRVSEFDLEHCPKSGGRLEIIATVLEQPLIEKILTPPAAGRGWTASSAFTGMIVRAVVHAMAVTQFGMRVRGNWPTAAARGRAPEVTRGLAILATLRR